MNDIMTSIKQVDGGCVIKSGDTASVFEFEILGDDGLKKDLSGIGKLAIFNAKKVILYEDVSVESGRYKLELKLDGFIFPTDEFKIRVRPSFNPSDSIPSNAEDPK